MTYSLPVSTRLFALVACVSALVPTLDASAAEANPAPPRITGSLTSNGLPRLACGLKGLAGVFA